MKGLYLVGANIVSDSEFRKKLAGRDAGVELQMVVEDLFNGWKSSETEDETNEDKNVVVEKIDNTNQEKYERNQLKITLKVFLREFSLESLKTAVGSALKQLGADSVDSLFLAVPTEAVPIIGIGSGSTGAGRTEALASLLEVWRGVEQLVEDGQVQAAGLCDLRPSVFMELYKQARIKPTSIQINLKSCCVVPEELSDFSKQNKVTLLTHSDPEELLSEETLRKLLYPHLKREAGHFSSNWISRYLVQLKDRGVLIEKRYILQLAK